MKRVEIILSQALEEDFALLCGEKSVGTKFTKVPTVLGRGYSSPKMGDSVWPQFNSLFIIYCKKEEAAVLKGIATLLHKEHPEEGIACFINSVGSDKKKKKADEPEKKSKKEK